jgi:hypothetical protein
MCLVSTYITNHYDFMTYIMFQYVCIMKTENIYLYYVHTIHFMASINLTCVLVF